MDHDLVIRYISTLGFPICAAIALGWAFWKIGWTVGTRLLDAHLDHLEDMRGDQKLQAAEQKLQTAELRIQSAVLNEIKLGQVHTCRAACPPVSGGSMLVGQTDMHGIKVIPEGH